MRIIIVLVAVCVLVLTACSGSENNINVESTDEQSKSAETQKPHGDVEFRDKGGSDVEVIVIEFTEEGKEIMAKKNKKLVGKEINLVVNGKLLYDCRLDEMISDGRWILTGFDSMAEIYKITNELEGVIN